MGRSANRLSSTRSGVVSSNVLRRIACLSFATPMPPLTLLEGKFRISGLRHHRTKHVQATDVLRLTFGRTQLFKHLFRIAPRQRRHTPVPQQFQIIQNRWTNGYQGLQFSLLCAHRNSPYTFIALPYRATSLNETTEDRK